MPLTKVMLQNYKDRTGHCAFGPSQAKRIELCPASVMEATQTPPRPASPAAKEGTYLHGVMEQVIPNGLAVAYQKFPSLKQTPDLYNYVVDAHSYFQEVLGSCSNETDLAVEVSGDLASMGNPETEGTADVVLRDWKNSIAHVIDWKFGKGELVFAQDNPQLKLYAGIALGYPCQIDKIVMHIAQPPRDNYTHFEMTYEELFKWITVKWRAAVDLAFATPEPPYNPSPEACKWCVVRHSCKARHEDGLKRAQDVFAQFAIKDQLTLEDWVSLYDKLTVCEAIRKEVYKHLVQTWESGKPIPGKKFVAGRSIRTWKNEDDAKAYLLSYGLTEDQLYSPPSLITPPAAEKLNRALKKESGFSELIIKPVGKPTLVGEDDEREALEP